jgi:16S rRNA (cytosine1402-N4)-methyltransferase
MIPAFSHTPVMPAEVLDGLRIRKNGLYVDGTIGGGGHSRLILEAVPEVSVIGIDKDADALAHTGRELEKYGRRLRLIHDDFKNIDGILDAEGVDKIDGALLDLGVSSYQLDTAERGFSYSDRAAPLDMRMDRAQTLTAETVVNTYGREELSAILREYGEEKFHGRIAARILQERERAPITTSGGLSDIICASIPAAARRTGGNPAKRSFMALRIRVNDELQGLGECVKRFIARLKTGGRLCVITFHSLEDRVVKLAMADRARGCVCPPKTPVCICGVTPEVRLVFKKPVTAGEAELKENNRSQSAKLRVCEKL